jgi:hypothetical protein
MNKLTKEELYEIQLLLENTLKPDTFLVNQSREALDHMKDKQPEKLILSLLYFLINGQRNYKLSGVLLRQMLTVMDDFRNFVWVKLSLDAQTLVKYNLAKTLAATTLDPDVRKNVCLVCSELAGTLADCEETWSELLSALDELLGRNADDSMKICGFQLLADTFPYFTNTYAKNLKELKTEFEISLIEDSFAVKAECLKAIISVISCIEPEQREMFESLIPLVTEAIFSKGGEDEKSLKSIIMDLTVIAESNARFLKDKFSKLFQVCIAIAKTPFRNKEIPGLAIELLITAIENAPSLLLEDKMLAEIGIYYSELFEAILSLMKRDVKEFPRDWINPTESLELPFDDSIALGQHAIDRILSCTRRDFGLCLLDPQVLKLFSGDWSCKYVALLAGARIGPFVRSPNELSVFIPSICNRAIKNKDPRIKLSAVRALRNLAEESDEVFHSHYHKMVMNGLLGILGNEIGRLRQEGCITTKSFIARLKREELDRYIEPLVKSLAQLIDNEGTPIYEIALSTMGTLIEVTPDTFCRHYYSQIMPILIGYLNSSDPKCRALRERLIEVLTIIAKQAGTERFRAYFTELAKVMTEQQKIHLQSKEIGRSSLTSWQRICQLYNTELEPYIDEIIEPLVMFAKPSVQLYMNNVGVHIEDYSEKEQALELLSTFIKYLSISLEKHATIIEELLILILKSTGNETLKPVAAKLLSNLLKAAKSAHSTDKAIKVALVALIASLKANKGLANTELEVRTTCDVLLLLEKPCFTEIEVLETFEILMNLSIDSNSRSIFLKEKLNEPNASASDYEDRLLSLLGQTIAALMRSHPSEFTEVFQVMYTKILKENLINPPSNSQAVFSLTIIAAALRYITYARIPAIYEDAVGLIMQYATRLDPQIRSVALEGLAGSVAGAGQHSATIAKQCFEFVRKILMTSMPEQVSRKGWQIAKERAVICLSQIILCQTSQQSIEMTALWLHNLPLKYGQGKEQIDFLAQRIATNITLVAGTNGENLKELLRVIAEVLYTNQVDKFSSEKLMEALRIIMTTKEWDKARSEAYNELPRITQNKLNGYATRVLQANY